MHLQIKAALSGSAGGSLGAMKAGDVVDAGKDPRAGRLARLLALLAEDWSSHRDPNLRHGPFNLLAAGGSGIELKGEFAFVVDAPDDDELEQQEHDAALARVKTEFRDSRIVRRIHRDLEHREGALHEFITELTQDGYLIDEVLVGVAHCPEPGAAGTLFVPVQVHAERLAGTSR